MAVNIAGEMKGIRILSQRTVQPSPPPPAATATAAGANIGGRPGQAKIIHLTPWDLNGLFPYYLQAGLLFPNPQPCPQTVAAAADDHGHIISNLITSFSHALHHFYPLAGRLASTIHQDGGSMSVSLHCTGQGADFIHAVAPDLKISDLLPSSHTVPPFAYSLFPLEGLHGFHGQDHPLLAAQVTQLADGFLVACAMNHAVVDAHSFWHFFNTWSRICRTDDPNVDNAAPPSFDRWFPDTRPVLPIGLPLNYTQPPQDLPAAPSRTPEEHSHCFFDLSPDSIKNLKATAIQQTGCPKISSLQAVLAHTWRAITRARRLQPEHPTAMVLQIGYRSRQLKPPVPSRYFGNIACGVTATASAKELDEESLGRTALRLNEAVAGHGEEDVYRWVESCCKAPSVPRLDPRMRNYVIVTWSPRDDVYGNDFGWGRPVAVQLGGRKRLGGVVSVLAGLEEGSMSLKLRFLTETMSALLKDEEFMDVVGG